MFITRYSICIWQPCYNEEGHNVKVELSLSPPLVLELMCRVIRSKIIQTLKQCKNIHCVVMLNFWYLKNVGKL